MDKLLAILKEVRPDINFDKEENLIEDGILESFDIVSIVTQIQEVFDIEIELTEIDPDDFGSCASMWNMIQRKLNE